VSGAVEINFDGLVGPTHNYAGLSEGNLASARNANMIARPREAALQGIAKMRRMRALGLHQGVLPPHERPNIGWLRSLGFSGRDGEVWEKAWRAEPMIARAALAASAMWAANAATISPSADTEDGVLHATVANLQTMLHRVMEAEQTERTLRLLMPEQSSRFQVHSALPAHDSLSDEGAANHMRMAADAGAPGVEIFVYGRGASEARTGFPARQTLEASRIIARSHRLTDPHVVFARQAPQAIDAGAFHNDVVAVAHEHVLFHHEDAFADTGALYGGVRAKARGFEPVFVQVPRAGVGLNDAVTSYLFNSQLVRLPGATSLTLIAPTEVRENNRTAAYVAEMMAQSNAAIGAVEYVEVRESMRNGGGPACLRLRIVMTAQERAAAEQGFFLTETLADQLEAWALTHYREELAPNDLGDPSLVVEVQTALDELTRILPLGADFYPFQR